MKSFNSQRPGARTLATLAYLYSHNFYGTAGDKTGATTLDPDYPLCKSVKR